MAQHQSVTIITVSQCDQYNITTVWPLSYYTPEYHSIIVSPVSQCQCNITLLQYYPTHHIIPKYHSATVVTTVNSGDNSITVWPVSHCDQYHSALVIYPAACKLAGSHRLLFQISEVKISLGIQADQRNTDMQSTTQSHRSRLTKQMQTCSLHNSHISSDWQRKAIHTAYFGSNQFNTPQDPQPPYTCSKLFSIGML